MARSFDEFQTQQRMKGTSGRKLATDHEACGQSCGNAPDELLAPGSGGQSCGKEMCEKAHDDWARRADEANKEL